MLSPFHWVVLVIGVSKFTLKDLLVTMVTFYVFAIASDATCKASVVKTWQYLRITCVAITYMTVSTLPKLVCINCVKIKHKSIGT